MKDFKDVYSCLGCQAASEGTDEFKCSGCGAYACQHLVLIDGGVILCFVCYKDQEREWPPWSYARIPSK